MADEDRGRLMPRGPMSPEQKIAAAARLVIGRETARKNREERIRLGIKTPQTPKQKARLRKMNAARKAREAAVNDAITAALAPVAVMGPDHPRMSRRVNDTPLTPQEAAAKARAAKPPAANTPRPGQSDVKLPTPTPAMSVDDRLAYYKAKLENKFFLWRPYPKQLEFLSMRKRERLFRGGNKVGKTFTGAGEAVAHLTGRYPDWWRGVRYSQPTLVWCGGLSGVAVRDAAQTILLGTPGDPSSLGTGMVPKDLIVGSPNASRSAPNGVDSFLVKHVSGGNSRCVFKTYEQGAGFWQGPYVHVIWLDEEAPPDVYDEALARLTGDGCLYTTFTPLIGYSTLVNRFLRPAETDLVDAARYRGHVQMTLAEAEHFTEEEKEQRRASYAPHLRVAREFGEPTLGEGAVFTTPEADLRINLSIHSVPDEWRKIWGLDFGSNHPFGAVLWGFDLENDVDYVLHCIKMRTSPNEPSILGHCEAIKRVCAQAPVAWPHDGAVSRNGEALKDIYKDYGLKMLETHALNAQGNHYTQPGIDAMEARMQARKLFVRNSPENENFFAEYRTYHRKHDPGTGRSHIVRINDDVMSAARIGYIMKQRARPVALGGPAAKRRPDPRTQMPINPWTGRPEFRL